MPSCSAADLSLPFTSPVMTSLAASRQDCPKEKYCAEVEQGRPRCPPGRCRYGGKEHAQDPCPDHDRPFGLEAATEAPAKAAKPAKRRPRRRPKKTAGRGKPATRSAPGRKAAKKAKTPKKAKKKTKR